MNGRAVVRVQRYGEKAHQYGRRRRDGHDMMLAYLLGDKQTGTLLLALCQRWLRSRFQATQGWSSVDYIYLRQVFGAPFLTHLRILWYGGR